MTTPHTITGRMEQIETPHWEPLRAAVGRELSDYFMWMNEITLADGRSVHLYKHITTRNYMHLGTDGSAFVYAGESTYQPIALARCIEACFDRWEQLLMPGEDAHMIRRELDAAVNRALGGDFREAA